MVVNKEEKCDQISKPLIFEDSNVKSKTYYGGEVITCISSFLSSHKVKSKQVVAENFEFIGAYVKLQKSSLSKENTRPGSTLLNVNFVDTVVIKEYPSFDFMLNETQQHDDTQCQEILLNYGDYEKTLTKKLEQETDNGKISLEKEEAKTKTNTVISKNDLKQQRSQEPSLDEVKAANKVNQMINKYKEMIDSRTLVNGIKKRMDHSIKQCT
jgi:hypothetical protein